VKGGAEGPLFLFGFKKVVDFAECTRYGFSLRGLLLFQSF
jgi:hypothetical protein